MGFLPFPGKTDTGFYWVSLRIRHSCCSIPELATRCSPTGSGIPQSSRADLGVSTEKYRFGPTLSSRSLSCSFGQTAYILILQQDDSWNKRAISEMQAFLLLLGDGLVPPCTVMIPLSERILPMCFPARPFWNPPPVTTPLPYAPPGVKATVLGLKIIN